MLRFFRQLRQRLLNDNKFSKYLLYAVGEILLVVVGILIALQVDNWNEERKLRQIELELLGVVYENLTNDLDDFEKNLIHLKNRKIACEVLLECAANDIVYQDSLAFFLHYTKVYPHFNPNISGYEMIKSEGIESITNDSLKLAITNLYEYGYKYLFTWENEGIDFNQNILTPLTRKYLGYTAVEHQDIPTSLDNSRDHLSLFANSGLVLNIKDFEGLKQDTELLTLWAGLKGHSDLLREIHQETENSVVDLVRRLENELNVQK
ncbi:DUF6090 family protein [Robiginitalea sp. SC105]|uniref:DUF6090 family protein n=1 Tax=Robiginitalea sp. SC105 TaxID=2762332 RepID=UPI00163B0F4E|nr:DUF6090 family protein [Robiginitalea sp. SC105]MBC2839868.1 hypothetical protein [Robiginitalea sp. SC105]